MVKKQKPTERDIILATLANTQSDRLSVLVPEIIKGDFSAHDYRALVPVKPRHQWPEPSELSVTYGETLGLIYQSQAAVGHAEFIHPFTKGVATVAVILGVEGQSVLMQALSKTIDPIMMGDAELEVVAPWLRPDLQRAATLILQFTDIGNLRDMLAWNYGLWYATVLLVGPNPDETGEEVLAYLRAVVDHFGHLGIPPA